MARDKDQLVVNLRGQALELHVGGKVVVVPPHGEATIRSSQDRVLGQVEELHRRRLVDLRDIPAVAGAPAPAPTPAAKRTSKATTISAAKTTSAVKKSSKATTTRKAAPQR